MKNRKLFEDLETVPKKEKVECLGLTFESDETRREYFREKLQEKLKDPEFRKIEGFPIGEDEDIVKLSDPPYYTACPNPFINDFVKHYGKPYNPEEKYSREPFAADVSEGKSDPIYNAHSYHTKVPHKAIMRYILHYTEPGDIVFDGFCGTGMTGVAAQMCGDKKTVESLGYTVLEDGKILDENGKAFSKLGARYAILNDLSPAATFIAYNYNTPIDAEAFEREAKRILEEVEAECGWMYLTLHNPTPDQIQKAVELLKEKGKGLKEDSVLHWGKINYTVWSDVFTCPECSGEVVFWEAAVDKDQGKVLSEFQCPHCGATLVKRNLERVMETKYDKAIGQTIKQAKQVPVLINYSVGKKRFEKTPDDFDLALIEHIETSYIPYWYPTYPMMFKGEKWGDTWRAGYHKGITHVHHFYTKRNLWTLASISKGIKNISNHNTKGRLFWSINSIQNYINKKQSFGGGGGGVSGTLYIPSLIQEKNLFDVYYRKVKKIQKLPIYQKALGILRSSFSLSLLCYNPV